MVKFPDGFGVDVSYQLREINPTTLEKMQRYVVSVEANILAKRARLRSKRRVIIKEEPYTSYVDAKIYTLVKTMVRMMERIRITNKDPLEKTNLVLRLEILNLG